MSVFRDIVVGVLQAPESTPKVEPGSRMTCAGVIAFNFLASTVYRLGGCGAKHGSCIRSTVAASAISDVMISLSCGI